MAHEKEIGKISHFFPHPSVAVVELADELRVGDKIHVKGHTSDFEQTVDSMQVEHEEIEVAKAGQQIGLKVKEHVREHDVVYKVMG